MIYRDKKIMISQHSDWLLMMQQCLLSDNCFIMVFTRRQMVRESMHMETAKQVAYWSTGCLCQSLLLREENKTDILQGVFIRIIILKAWSLHLHSKLAQQGHMLCSLKYWTEPHIEPRKATPRIPFSAIDFHLPSGCGGPANTLSRFLFSLRGIRTMLYCCSHVLHLKMLG